jgi:ferric-dicitrate binding protein FerR (iron transport regulator)
MAELKMKGDNNQKKRAEDILSDDSLSESLITGEIQQNEFQEEELFLADRIHQTVSDNRILFGADQKNLLDQKIIDSINRSKRNKNFAWVGSAASLLVLIGLTIFFQLNSRSGISDFASTIQVKSDSDYTQLMLSGKQVIQIDAQESKIAYSGNGKVIKIDAQEKVEQPVEADVVSYNTVVVPYGKRTQITLSDSSTIWLNSGSKLVYPVHFADNKREVFLDGEAVFKVTPDKSHPFHVVTRDMEIKVLGTVFDLCAYSDDSTVNTVLERGSVELIYKQGSVFGPTKEKMVPGMLAAYDLADKTLIQKKVNTKDYTSWKDGYLIMEKNSLGSIAKKLSRYYNVSIEIESPELAGETFSGYLDLRNSATQVLSLISEMMDIELEQSDHLIKIRKKQTPG